jgi:hypothetical protein
MWLAAVALVALAAQECSGFQCSFHIACRSPAFAPHLALSPAVRKTLSSHHNSQRLQALGVLLRSGSIGLGLTFLARLMIVLRAESGFFEVASEKRDAHDTAEPAPLCIANIVPLQNMCMHCLVQILNSCTGLGIFMHRWRGCQAQTLHPPTHPQPRNTYFVVLDGGNKTT